LRLPRTLPLLSFLRLPYSTSFFRILLLPLTLPCLSTCLLSSIRVLLSL
jgi:hypothetical protein